MLIIMTFQPGISTQILRIGSILFHSREKTKLRFNTKVGDKIGDPF